MTKTSIKHITLISLNFYPEDTAIGLYSTQLAEFLEKKGAKVSVITGFPYYPKWEISEAYKKEKPFLQEKKGTIAIYRYKQFVPAQPSFVKRVAHIADFTFGSRINFKQIKECDLVISIIPFTSSAWLGNMLSRKRNAKHWIHIQDFEFDAAFQSGVVASKKGVLYNTLMSLERSILNKADRTSTISKSMLTKLKTKTSSTTFLLPNWVHLNPYESSSDRHPYFSSDKFSLLYAGNIGDKQDWDFFTKVVENIDFATYEVIVVGAGSKVRQVERLARNHKGLKFYSPVPLDQLSTLLSSTGAHIFFQKTTIKDTVMPSKILGMMASGRPSIITGHPEAEPAHIIKEADAGFYNQTNNVDEVLEQIDILSSDSAMCAKMGESARTYVKERFDRDHILNNFWNALTQL